MRLLFGVGLVALLVTVPAAATSVAGKGPGDGCLVVQDGKGIVTVTAKGTVFGRFLTGQVLIEDRDTSDGKEPVVSGAEKTRVRTETKTLHIGENVRFRASGRFRIRLEAVYMDVSLVGRGSVVLSSTSEDLPAFSDPGTFSVDAESFCQEGFQTLPDVPARYVIGTQAAA